MASWMKKTGMLLPVVRRVSTDAEQDRGSAGELTNDIPVPLLRVELDRKSTNIPHGICAPSASKHSREPQKHRRLPRRIRQHPSTRHILRALMQRELAKRARAPRMHNPLRNPLMIKAMDLLASKGILQRHRTRVVFIHDLEPVIRVLLLDAVVGCDSVAGIVDVLRDGG